MCVCARVCVCVVCMCVFLRCAHTCVCIVCVWPALLRLSFLIRKMDPIALR